MTRKDFLTQVKKHNIRLDAFDLNGAGNETYALAGEGTLWKVFYSERGLETGAQLFETESAALEGLLGRLLADDTTRA
ncbi:MAG: hypothetical protein P8J20_02540 [Novosphingobium sp.]|nr:hypothetical protein [Novosphingobium sp.]